VRRQEPSGGISLLDGQKNRGARRVPRSFGGGRQELSAMRLLPTLPLTTPKGINF